ncbi:MAG: GFA family protein [Gammaproteobacteria bacterium]|nr:MAG: GFA family protein [Gammaproteobacteria bacterium]
MTEVNISGSCLCGAVQYAIHGEALRFYHCHCRRCRKTTGTGHASNMLVQPESCLIWNQGEDMLVHYKVPEAERFYNLFCKQCGSPMPRQVPELQGVIIPAGTLDDEPPIQPSARIFWGSRADWSCDAGGLPVHTEYPA